MAVSANTNWFDSLLLPHEAHIIHLVFRETNEPSGYPEYNEEEFFYFAAKNGLGGAVYRLINNRTSTYSAGLLKKLKNEYLKILVNNTNLLKAASDIEDLLRKEGIPVLYLKGILLAAVLYDDVAQRPMSDVDLLVPEDQVARAFELLKMNGAELVHPEALDEPHNHHLPMLRFKNAPIELHRLLFPELSKYFIPSEPIWANATSWTRGRLSVPGPSYQHAFVYQALHVYYTFLRGGLRLGWLLDFHLLLKKDIVQLDDEFWHLVKTWKVEYPVQFILGLLGVLEGRMILTTDAHEKKMLRDIKQALLFFRSSDEQDTDYSYQLVWEQIKNAPGIKAKVRLIKSKVYKETQHAGCCYLIKRILVLLNRTFGMFINRLKQGLKRL